MGIENNHYFYIKEFLNCIIPKKFLNNIIKFKIKNNFINYFNKYTDSFIDKNIYTKNNPKIYIKNYLFKYSNLNKTTSLLIYKKKYKNLEKFYSPFLIRNFLNFYKKKKNISYFFYKRKNFINFFYTILNKKYKKLNNSIFLNYLKKKPSKYKLLNNNLYFNKYIQNYLDIFTKNICKNYITNIKIKNKKYNKFNNINFFNNKKFNKNINFSNNKKISFFYYNKLYNLYFY
jgi:hypothetical protein